MNIDPDRLTLCHQMRYYDNSGVEEEDSAGLTSIPLPENSNFVSPTVHIRTVRAFVYLPNVVKQECHYKGSHNIT